MVSLQRFQTSKIILMSLAAITVVPIILVAVAVYWFLSYFLILVFSVDRECACIPGIWGNVAPWAPLLPFVLLAALWWMMKVKGGWYRLTFGAAGLLFMIYSASFSGMGLLLYVFHGLYR